MLLHEFKDLSESGLFGQYMDDLILGSKCQNDFADYYYM